MKLIKFTYFILFASIIIGLLPTYSNAQSPMEISYQAVVRNANNELIKNQMVGIRISILANSSNGNVEYTETQTPTTNSFGLIAIEIGKGSSSDNLSLIDWSEGIYFIKTETDPNGGTDYTITGTSQLLSVPYSFHSNTTDSIIGGIREVDPVFSSAIAASITESDTTYWNSKLDQELDGDITNELEMPDDVTEGDMAYYNGANWESIAAPDENSMVLTFCNGKPTWTTDGQCPANEGEVGDYHEGGVVFYIFQEGDADYVENENHGLISAITDQDGGTDTEWGCIGSTVSGADDETIGSGSQNTVDIVSSCTETNIAAALCSNYSFDGYDDWYLPSKEELNLLYENRDLINSIATANGGTEFGTPIYWSSSEFSSNEALGQYFLNGYQGQYDKNVLRNVRSIRKF